MDVYKEIRRLQLEGVTSQRTAAKRLGISRNTVKKYWEGDNVPWEHKPYNRDATVMTPEVVRFVKDCLDEDDAVNIKRQRHTARRIYQRLVEERDFTGSESSVRNLVHDMRAARRISQVFIPLRFAPGDAVQIDWGEATVIMDGEKEKVNLFCARLCHSCAPYVIAYKRQNLESFLDAISDCYERKSLIITSSLEFSQWNTVFGDNRLTAALVDRLIHHSHIVIFSGESYRLSQSIRRQRASP